MYEIEKGVPHTPSRNSRHSFPFGQMDVGDSFYFEGERNIIASAAAWFGIRHSKKFSVRKSDAGFRVWRTS